jgi:hypothetical protein
MEPPDRRSRLHYRLNLGPGITGPLSERKQPASAGHRLFEQRRVIETPILGGLQCDYRLAQEAA